ncbi:MAG: hypothetical protein SFX74_07390 [Fimbriimonadaceae bacterium]|nr:hypothetical protein [Fimbriimonadaceae bacterium]
MAALGWATPDTPTPVANAFGLKPAGDAYHVQTPSGVAAKFRENGAFEIGFGTRSVSVSAKAYGRGGTRVSAGTAEMSRRGESIHYRRDGIREWYDNHASGIKHSFEIARRPSPSIAAGYLYVQLAVRGDARLAAVSDDHVTVQVCGKTLDYQGLKVWDAQRRALPARMVVKGQSIEIQVDDRAAQYPVTIDPTWVNGSRIHHPSNAVGTQFGDCVAINGNWMAVGAPNESTTGRVHLYRRVSGQWVFSRTFEAPESNMRYFGASIDIDGNRMIIGAPLSTNANGWQVGAVAIYSYFQPMDIWTDPEVQWSPARSESNPDSFGDDVEFIERGFVATAPYRRNSGGSQVGAIDSYWFNGNDYEYTQTVLNTQGGQMTRLAYSDGKLFVAHALHNLGGRVRAFTTDSAYLTAAEEYTHPNASSGFAMAVDANDGRLIVGDTQFQNGGGVRGRAYIYNTTTQTLEATFNSPSSQSMSTFGRQVAMFGNYAAVVLEGSIFTSSTPVRVELYWSNGTSWFPLGTVRDQLTSVRWVALEAGVLAFGEPGYRVGSNFIGAVYPVDLVEYQLSATGPATSAIGETMTARVDVTPNAGSAIAGTITGPAGLLAGPVNFTIPAGSSGVDVPVGISASVAPGEYELTATLATGEIAEFSTVVLQRETPTFTFPARVKAGTRVPMTISLANARPMDTAIAVTSNHSDVIVPASVTIPRSETSVTFDVVIRSLPESYSFTIGTSGFMLNPAGLTRSVAAPIVGSVRVNRTTVPIGGSVLGTVILTAVAPAGGLTVNLSTQPNGPLSMPASVTVPEGQSRVSFSMTASPVSADTPVVIRANSVAGEQRRADVTVLNQYDLVEFSLPVNEMQTSGQLTGTVRLAGPAGPGGVMVSLSSSTSRFTVPPTVTIPEGSDRARVPINSGTSPMTGGRISATVGATTMSATLNSVLVSVSSVSIDTATVTAGSTAQFSVTLSRPAPAGGALVQLFSNAPTVAGLPSQILIPAGETTGSATVTTFVGRAGSVGLSARTASTRSRGLALVVIR